jgi:hypothetical protein
VYLLRVVEQAPKAKIPLVLLPAAAVPYELDEVAAVAALTAQVEYVYLSRVAVKLPSANIAKEPSADGVTLLLNALIGEGP